MAPLAAPSWTPHLGQFWLPRQKYYIELEFLDDFHICCTELPPVCRNASGFQIARFRKKLRPSEDMSFSCFFKCTYLGGGFSHCCPNTWPDQVDLAEFLIFFTKKVPNNIAASRLKIGHTYVPLQPFEAMACWIGISTSYLVWQPFIMCPLFTNLDMSHMSQLIVPSYEIHNSHELIWTLTCHLIIPYELSYAIS